MEKLNTAMKDQHLTPNEEAAITQKINLELIDKQFHLLRYAVITNIIAMFLPAWALSYSVSRTLIVSWLIAMSIVQGINIALAFYYQYRAPTASEVNPWIYTIRCTGFISAFTWGSIGFLLITNDPQNQAIILFFLTLVASGFALATSAEYISSIISISCTLIPFIIWHFYQTYQHAPGLHLQYAAGIIVYMAFLLAVSLVGYCQAKKSTELSFINIALKEKLALINKQVAHDIRSPLTALDMIMKDIMSIPEDERILFQNSINRIHKIANNLLSQYNKKNILNPKEKLNTVTEDQQLTSNEEALIKQKINLELVDKHFHIVRSAAIANMVASFIPLWALSHSVPFTFLIGWFIAMWIVQGVNLALTFYYQYRAPSASEVNPWIYTLRCSIFTFAFTWGSAGFLLVTNDPQNQALIMFSLTLVASAFALGTAKDHISSIIGISCTLVPFIIWQFYQAYEHESGLHIQYGTGLIVYMAFLLVVSHVGYHLAKKSIELSFINIALKEKLTLINKQVAHDIRSPLTALDMIMKNIMIIPEDERILFRNSINRIHDIANNLLTEYNKKNILNQKKITFENSTELVSDLISSVVSEKRMQYKDIQVKFLTHTDSSAYDCFVNVSASDLKRALSNLLNNAVEALGHKNNGLVQIRLTTQSNQVMILIQDNGCGIPSDFLLKINAGEISTRKKHGHGLGLSYAIQHIKEKWKGQFIIKSRVNEGTTINITLPKSPTPKWFCPQLSIKPKQKIIILDDDESIHQVWHKRLKEIKPDIQFIDYYHPDNLLKNNQNTSFKDTIFLVAYEFLGHNKTGLNVIAEANIASQAYLVTSRYEEHEIRDYCEQSNIKIIPKSFAPHIPIHLIDENKLYDAILIDDDMMIHATWQLVAKKMKKKLDVYSTVDSFMLDIDHLDKATLIYIDVNLANGIRGDVISENIYSHGFKEIYLTTGYEKSQFADLPWIKAVVDKNPPWQGK